MKRIPATKKDVRKACANCSHAIYWTKWSGLTCGCGTPEVLTNKI